MDLQNLAYALTQVVHNFGAVAVAGAAILARWPQAVLPRTRHRLAGLILMGWLMQGASGVGFGAISFAYYGEFPDIQGVARGALFLKLACAIGGVVLSAAYLRYHGAWSDQRQATVWAGMILLGVTALTAAAFLRWFS